MIPRLKSKMSMNKMYNDTATTPNKTPEKIEMSRIKLRDDTTTPPTKTDTGSANENITDKSDLPPEVDDVEQVTRAETAATSRSGTSMATTDGNYL